MIEDRILAVEKSIQASCDARRMLDRMAADALTGWLSKPLSSVTPFRAKWLLARTTDRQQDFEAQRYFRAEFAKLPQALQAEAQKHARAS